jgi:hypothetical protein
MLNRFVRGFHTWRIKTNRTHWRSLSEVRRRTNNPQWDLVTLDVRDLMGDGEGDDEQPLLLQCWDWDRHIHHTCIGTCLTTLKQLTEVQSLTLVKMQRCPTTVAGEGAASAAVTAGRIGVRLLISHRDPTTHERRSAAAIRSPFVSHL